MNISIYGTGYVGLVTGACFAEMGNNVVCVDNDKEKVQHIKEGRLPIHEPGLDNLVASNLREGRLRFTTVYADAVSESDVHFIAVGTPPSADGSADLQQVLQVARELGCLISRDCTVIDKSTVPVGTAERVRSTIASELGRRNLRVTFDVVSNPEFLKEGDAINDFMRPDRVIIGTESERAAELMRRIYTPYTRNHERMLVMGVRDAEMTKYVANAMLATRISFMNEVAMLCERLGVNVENVRKGIGSDSRIGYSFIYPGCGYGGSCFPKDIKALAHLARQHDVDPMILRAVDARNELQKRHLFTRISKRFGRQLEGYEFGIWGLAFKPGTDDMREAPSVVLLHELISAGAKVKAYDPAALDTARHTLPAEWFRSGRLTLTDHQYDALDGAAALALITEWKPFRYPDFGVVKKRMKHPIIFDGRNLYDPMELRSLGFEYFGIGK